HPASEAAATDIEQRRGRLQPVGAEKIELQLADLVPQTADDLPMPALCDSRGNAVEVLIEAWVSHPAGASRPRVNGSTLSPLADAQKTLRHHAHALWLR